MPDRKSPEDLTPAQLELRKLGQAMAAVRRRKGLTQDQMGAALGVSTQAYQRYEAGHRKLPEWKLTQLAAAAGATLKDVMEERARLDDDAVASVAPFQPRPSDQPALLNELAFLLGPGADRLRLDTEALSPWAESGEMIVYDRQRPPRRDQGCVVEDQDGRLSVHLFGGRDEDTVRLFTLAPERRAIERPSAEVRGIYAVRFRGD